MKFRLLLSVATGVLVASGTAVWVMACDKDAKSATAAVATSSKSATCTPAMAAKCTPEQAAACRAKGASAVTADMASGVCPHAAAMKMAKDGATCGSHASMAKSAAHGSCAGKTNGATAAIHEDDATVIMPAGASCGTSKGTKATAAGNGYSCGGKGVTAMAGRSQHANCDACADMSDCDGELRNSGAITQVVKLKNGIMYVYTAQQPGKVRAVQAAVAQRNERLVAMTASGEKAKLCPDCKAMRGAVASGKLNREMVTIEGGCMTLVTSTDRAIVSKLHAMVAHASTHAKI